MDLTNVEQFLITFPRGLMDMASDYESGDSGFESRRGSSSLLCVGHTASNLLRELEMLLNLLNVERV